MTFSRLVCCLFLSVAACVCPAQTFPPAVPADSMPGAAHPYRMIEAAIAGEEWGKAADICDDLLEANPEDLAAHYYAGICQRELGTQTAVLLRMLKWKKAAEHFEAVLGKDSLFRDVLYQLARLMEYKEDWPEAIALATRQVLLRPDQPGAGVGLMHIYRHYIAEIAPDEALSWLLEQNNNHARYLAAEVLRRQKEYARAESMLVRLLKEPLDLPPQACYLSLARLHASLNDDVRSQSEYRKAVESIASLTGAALLFEDLKYVISDRELARYRSLFSDRQKVAFFQEFWRVRNPTPASALNPRLIEHVRRYVYAEEQFEYYGFRTSFSNPDALKRLQLPKAFSLNREFNDKGLVYLRQGPPDEIERTTGGLGSGLRSVDPHESWLYNAPEGEPQRILHFALHNAVSNNWRLTPLPGDPAMLENLATWDVRYQRLLTGNPLEAMRLSLDLQEEEEKAVAATLETDRHVWGKGTTQFLVPHAIDAFRSTQGRTLLDVSYAIPLGALLAASGDTARTVLVETGLSTMFPDGRQLSSRIDTLAMALTTHRGGSYIGLCRQLVVPDSLHFAFHVRALDVPAVGTWSEHLRVPSFTGDGFLVSDLQLLLPSSHGPSIEIEGVKVVQSPFTTYRNSRPLFAYLQVYNLVKDMGGKTAYTARYVLAPADDPDEVTVLDEVQRELSDDSRVEFRTLDITDVSPGTYRLTVSVTDRKRVQTVKRWRQIEITK